MKREPLDNQNAIASTISNLKDRLADKLGSALERHKSAQFSFSCEQFLTKASTLGSTLQDRKRELFVATTVFLQQRDLLQWTKHLMAGAASEYDRAMDDVFRTTHIAGAEHRLFDGGHTILGSLEAVKDVHGGDIHYFEWVHAYMKDLTTPMGMPYVTLDQRDYDRWVENFAGKIPGVDSKYLYDLLTFDAMEIIATGFSLAAVWFAFKKEDKEKVAQILGAMGISSITAANPVMGLATIFVTAYAYWRHGGINLAEVAKGGGLAAFSAFMFSIMGLPVLVEFGIVVSLSIILRNYIFDNPEFYEWLRSKLQQTLAAGLDSFDYESFLSWIPIYDASRWATQK